MSKSKFYSVKNAIPFLESSFFLLMFKHNLIIATSIFESNNPKLTNLNDLGNICHQYIDKNKFHRVNNET